MSITEMSVRKRTAKEQLAYDMGYQMGKHDAVRHGRWIKNNIKNPAFVICSECETVWYNEYNYCPNCGAKMDKGAE